MSIEVVEDKNYKDAIAEGKSIIKFWAGWCGTCRLLSPKFKRLSEDVQYKQIKFIDIDAEKNPTARKWAAVTSLPFFAIVENGEIISADSAGKEEKIIELLTQLKEA
jgi:thiol-disulfide isomerase/thioredoxin